MTSAGSILFLVGVCVFVVLCAGLFAGGSRALAAEPPQWWQRGQDTWYYKDDWKAQYLNGSRAYRTTIELPEAPAAAYAYVWSSGGYTFRVNGQIVGRDVDDGTIEDYDIAALLKPGENTIEADAGSEFICEGAAVLDDGREIAFASDASWAPQGARAGRERQTGPRGYGGDTHMARVVTVTAEQKAKAQTNRLNSIRVRILDRDRYNFWKHRDPREVLALGEPTGPREQWAAIERLLEEAREPIAAATQLVLDGQFDQVEAALQPAIERTEQAEQVLAALMRQLEEQAANRRAGLEGARQFDERTQLSYNASRRNRLGWVASCEPLDNDPAYWEFDVAPPQANSIALAGWWQFTLDPNDRGLQSGYHSDRTSDAGWKRLYAPTKWGWERWGYIDDNPNERGFNKPYNGLAWYRKTLVIPAAWEGHDLVLRLGPRWGNRDWLAVNGQWVSAPDQGGSNADTITIPASLVRFGQPNTLALRVRNGDNIGGIINPGLRLSVAQREPYVRRHIAGPGAAREQVFRTPGGDVTQIVYSSALSPAAVVATDGRTIRIGGWAARGFDAPTRAALDSGAGVEAAELPAESISAGGDALGANWMLFWGTGEGETVARPLLVVFERRPREIGWVDDGFGGRAIELTFSEPGARIALLRPFEEPLGQALTPEQLDRVRLWSRALTRYPVGYHETLTHGDDAADTALRYEYLDLSGDWRTEPLELAPLPMLFSYATENDWPGARPVGEVIDLGCRAQSLYYPGSDCGTYRAARGDRVAYRFDRMEPKIHYKGAGTLGEELQLGEPMYARMAEWGFNAYRPQIRHYGGIPRAADYADPQKIAWFDETLALSRKHGMTCIVNWFTDQNVPENRRQDFIDRWAGMARHVRDLPAEAVMYDFINEPAGMRWDRYNAFMKEVTAAVRAADPVHPITVEFGGGWAQPEDADMTEPTGDENTIYQYHFYGPHTDDVHRQDLWYPRYEPAEERFRSYEGWEERMLSPVRFGIRHRKELMHGEFGISFLGPDEAPRRWLEDVLDIHEKYRMHWNWWNYSGGEIHRTGLMAGDRVNPLVETLSEYARQ